MAASASAPLLHDRPPAYNETQGQAAGYYPPAAGAVGPGHPMPPPGYAQPPAGSAGYGPPPPAGAAGVVPKHPVPPYGGQYPGSYQGGAPAGSYQQGPPGYRPYPGQQPSYMQGTTTTVMVQPQPSVIVVGGCPACRVGVLEDDFTCLGVCCAILFFPLGILCCLAMRQRRCPNCGAVFG